MRFRITVPLGVRPEVAIEQMSAYLRKRGADISRAEAGTLVANAPVALFGFDRRLYSRDNVLGINPLAVLDAVSVIAIPTDNGSRLELSVLSLRAYFLPALLLLVGAVAYLDAAPIAALAFLLFVLASYALLVWWLITHALGHEIQRYSSSAL